MVSSSRVICTMDIKDLRIFARVAALGNLSAVATELGVSAGTISKRIQSLEDEIGVRLIDRTTRSSRLTEEGRMYLQRVERILLEVEHAQDEISANSGAPAGRLKISAPASLSRQIVVPALVSFADAYPAIEVCVDITDRFANLHDEGYDVAIRAGTLSDGTMKAKRLVGDRVVLSASPSYIEQYGAPQRPSDLSDHRCLLHGDQRNWVLARDGETDAVRIAGQLGSDSGDFLHMAALQGVGILRASEIAVQEDVMAGRLIRVLPDYELASDAAIWAVYPNAKHAMPRLRVFLDHIAEFCRERVNTSQRQNSRNHMGQEKAGPMMAARLESQDKGSPRAWRQKS